MWEVPLVPMMSPEVDMDLVEPRDMPSRGYRFTLALALIALKTSSAG
jgi:hypothetical protein